MRDQIKLEMETIDQQLDPYVHDEDDPCVREIEAKRAQVIRHLFENIAQQRKEFISLLVEECIGLMGPPPCKYALIGLGSQATGLVTPYSDLEFAILVEEESDKYVEYFLNFTHYLHLKVVNLGETILPALGIKSLNGWYYDSVTPRGFAFDGSMPKASKTPLGRQGTTNELPSRLICSPSNMASKLQNDATLYLKEGYHLATILRNPCLIAGHKYLIDTYMATTGKILKADGGTTAQELAQEMLRENTERFSNEETITARLTDVKKDIYRFPAVAVDCLALSSHIVPITVWETIEELEKQQVISPNNAHHLTVLTSISAELRLRTYIANGGQKENMSALASVETTLHGSSNHNDNVQASALIPVFYIKSNQQLFRYYYTAVPLKKVMQEWSEKKQFLTSISDKTPLLTNISTDLYENSTRVQGKMYSELCKYEQALGCYQEALNKTDGTDIMEKSALLKDIGHAYLSVGNFPNAISFCEQAIQMYRSIYGPTTAHPHIATSLNNLGSAWSNLGNNRQAISYYEQDLQMSRSIYGPTTAHPHIATSLNNLGSAWSRLGNNRQAISYYEQALQMRKSTYGPTTAHPDIATSLNNLGSAWSRLGNNRQAISYYEQALQMSRSIYGPTTAHPDIATSLNNLGGAWSHLGDNRQAISYFEQALQMKMSIYGPTTAHPHIATLLNNLGSAWSRLGNNRQAISYYEQALQMRRSIYGPTIAHPHIANSLNNLGAAWSRLGNNRQAISYYEQDLQMSRSIYGPTTAHPDIATSVNNLGLAWSNLGNHRQAISYHEEVLQMHRSIYGPTTAHPHIATSLNNLGTAWSRLGNNRQAISYFEQALQMRRSIYGPTTAHPDIATSLNNLGVAWSDLGNNRQAISYYEQALQMHRSIYGPTTAHHDIANSLNSLSLAWRRLGNNRQAISYHEQAEQVQRRIYDQTTV
ncbi:uncharacterized protein LOC144860484 [Branchiostoma floridae x Branchiostoma japonicum]